MDMHKAPNARERSPLSVAMAEHLRAEMGVARLSTRALARKAGMGERTLARIASGERTMDVVQLERIAKALDVTMGEFLERAQRRLDEADDPHERNPAAG